MFWFFKKKEKKESDLKIYIAAHKNFVTPLPKDKDVYVLCPQSRDVKDKRLDIMYIDDEFTMKWKKSYSEGCLLHYLWKHSEILPQFVGINHYRRFFKQYYDSPLDAIKTLENKDAIIMHEYIHKKPFTNGIVMRLAHPSYDADLLKGIIRVYYKDYFDAYKEMENDCKQYPCSMFIMKKEDFLEMCEFVFGVLDIYNEKQSFECDKDVYKYIMFQRLEHNECTYQTFDWQTRLHGFWLEWLCETYWRKKYGIDNCEVADYYLALTEKEKAKEKKIIFLV